MRVIGIGGIWSSNNPVWATLGPAFERAFVHARFIPDDVFGHPWSFGTFRSHGDAVVRRHDTSGEVVIVGYSMGGVVACAIASAFRRARVHGVVTLYAPHTFIGSFFTAQLGAPRCPPVPVVSFGARYDEIVWWGARHPCALEHHDMPSTHFIDLLVRDDIADTIARYSAQALMLG